MSGCGIDGEGELDNSIADNDEFVAMLRMADEDNKTKMILIAILSLEVSQRVPALKSLIEDMKLNNAPSDFILAIAAFLNNEVAEKTLKLLTNPVDDL
jgi:hypothetical protein